MSQHNCRIGKTKFMYDYYTCNVKSHVNKLSENERERNSHFIKHLEETGKINKFL